MPFPPIQEESEGELSDIDSYDYRKHGVVKALGRTDLEDDSDDGLDELYEQLSIKSRTTDKVDTRTPGTQPLHLSSAVETRSTPSSPSSQKQHSPQMLPRSTQELSSRKNMKMVTPQSPNVTCRFGQTQTASVLQSDEKNK